MLPYGGADLAASFRTVRGNTIRIADEIPEEHYGFVAAPGIRSVRETLSHLAVATRLWYDMHGTRRLTQLAGYDFMGMHASMSAEETKPRSKAEVIEFLTTEGEQFATWLEGLSDEQLSEAVTDPRGVTKPRIGSLLSPKEHEMHHRGQLMLIERQLGIVPHLTRAMMERVAMMLKAREPETATA